MINPLNYHPFSEIIEQSYQDFYSPEDSLPSFDEKYYDSSLYLGLPPPDLAIIWKNDVEKNNEPYIDKVEMEIESENKPKQKELFKTNQIIIPQEPFLENKINTKLSLMNKRKKIELDKDCHHIIIERIRLELKTNSKKRIRGLKLTAEIISNEGRRKKCDLRKDIMISRIINMCSNSLILTINKIINAVYDKEQKKKILISINLSKDKSEQIIKKIDYQKYKEHMKTMNDYLKLLSLTIGQYLSRELSSKFKEKNYPKNYNEIVMNNILKDENNNEIFKFLFNCLKYEDWVDIFIYKKELEDFDEYNSLDENQRKIIKENLDRLDNYIYKIYKKDNDKTANDKIYFHSFCLLIYNLKTYLSLIEKRVRKKLENNTNC